MDTQSNATEYCLKSNEVLSSVTIKNTGAAEKVLFPAYSVQTGNAIHS